MIIVVMTKVKYFLSFFYCMCVCVCECFSFILFTAFDMAEHSFLMSDYPQLVSVLIFFLLSSLFHFVWRCARFSSRYNHQINIFASVVYAHCYYGCCLCVYFILCISVSGSCNAFIFHTCFRRAHHKMEYSLRSFSFDGQMKKERKKKQPKIRTLISDGKGKRSREKL